jgi:CBS domain-containing protein
MTRTRGIPTVDAVMTPDPIVLSIEDGLPHAARTLEESEISGAPVVDADGRVVGVLSESDLVRARATEHLWSGWPGLRVRHLMHSPAITADPSMTITEAAELMERMHVHRLIVVDPELEAPIGVLSMSDLVRAMIGERDDD